MKLEFFIAFRYLKARRRALSALVTTLIAVAGVTLGVAALNITLAVMNGFHKDIQDKILGIQSHIVVLLQGSAQVDSAPVQNKILALKGIETAAPFVYGQILLRHEAKVSGAIVKGVDPAAEDRLSKIKDFIKEGSWSDFSNPDSRGIIVGDELAQNLGLEVGDLVNVIPPTSAVARMGLLPKIETFKVSAIFQSGYYEYDSGLVYAYLPQAQKLLEMDGKITGFGVRLKSLNQLNAVVHSLRQELGLSAWVRSWEDLNKPLFSALKLEKIMMFLILIMIVLVAASNIVSNLLIITMEKTKDIGILKALGIGAGRIRRIFIMEGTMIGLLGVLTGSLSGVIISVVLDRTHWIKLPADVYYLSSLPVYIEWSDVGIIAAAALGITILSTLYPAERASRIEPMSAIRAE